MELLELILSINNNYYAEIVRFYNETQTIKHVFEITQKRAFCKKVIEYFSNFENINTFLRSNFTLENEIYLAATILSNPLNAIFKIENEQTLSKLQPFKKCGFIFSIKKDYFTIPDEIFLILLNYFSKRKNIILNNEYIGNEIEIKKYITTFDENSYFLKTSRVLLDPYFYFIKLLYFSIAESITKSTAINELFENVVKELRGKFPIIDALKKFISSNELLLEIKKGKEIDSGFYTKINELSDGEWLTVQISKFINNYFATINPKINELLLKFLKSDLYFNLKSCSLPDNEIEVVIKLLMCLGICEVIFLNNEPIYVKLTTFGEKIFNILFPTLESLSNEISEVKRKVVRKTAILTSDFKLICNNLDIIQFIKCLCFANLVLIDNVFTFEITKDTIMRSIKLGANYLDFKNFISKFVKEIPDNVIKTVLDWFNSIVVINHKKCVLINIIASNDKLLVIDKDENFHLLIIAKIKLGQYVILPEKIEAVEKYFSDRSIPYTLI